jgi:hypothetical protein
MDWYVVGQMVMQALGPYIAPAMAAAFALVVILYVYMTLRKLTR